MTALFFFAEGEASLSISASRRLRSRCTAQLHLFSYHLEIKSSSLPWPAMPQMTWALLAYIALFYIIRSQIPQHIFLFLRHAKEPLHFFLSLEYRALSLLSPGFVLRSQLRHYLLREAFLATLFKRASSSQNTLTHYPILIFIVKVISIIILVIKNFLSYPTSPLYLHH